MQYAPTNANLCKFAFFCVIPINSEQSPACYSKCCRIIGYKNSAKRIKPKSVK